jgi:LPXTG-motif cell wall-anchored protein
MPETASEIPLIAAIGAGALALAGLFYLLRNRMIRLA